MSEQLYDVIEVYNHYPPVVHTSELTDEEAEGLIVEMIGFFPDHDFYKVPHVHIEEPQQRSYSREAADGWEDFFDR